MALLSNKTFKSTEFQSILDGLRDLRLLSPDTNIQEKCDVNTDLTDYVFTLTFTEQEGDTVRFVAKQQRTIGKKLVNPDYLIKVYNHANDTAFELEPRDLDQTQSFINGTTKTARIMRDMLSLALSEHVRLTKANRKESAEETINRLMSENAALKAERDNFRLTMAQIHAVPFLNELKEVIATRNVGDNAFIHRQSLMLPQLIDAIKSLGGKDE